MKFARYLEETQTPEWKKAYIDYRGLKKRITAIRRAPLQTVHSPAGSTTHLSVNESPRSSNDHNDNEPHGRSTVTEQRGHASSVQGQRPFVFPCLI
ncbi:hypothetical protein AB1N83_012317 [Pleurotus pulmonarius]